MCITVFVSLYTTRLILNSLGASDFGIFGVVGGAIALLGFLNSTLTITTRRFLNYTQGQGFLERQKTIFNNSVALHLLISFFVVLTLEAGGYFFFNGILNIEQDRIYAAKWIYQFAIISTWFTVVSAPYDAAINAHEDMLFYAIIGIIESLGKLIIAVFIVFTSGDKLIWYGLFMAVLTVLLLFIRWGYCIIYYAECHLSLRRYVNIHEIKELGSFAGWNLLNTFTNVSLNYGGTIVMNFFFGTAVNAAQNVGAQLRGQLMALSTNMLKALDPVITKKEGAGDRASMLYFSFIGCKWAYLIFALLALPFIVETEFYMEVWLKNVPEWCICFARYLMIIGLLEQLTVTLNSALNSTGKIKDVSIKCAILRFCTLLTLIVVFHLGATPDWLNILTLFSSGILYGIIMLYECRKHCGLQISMYVQTVLIPCMICTSITLFAGLGLRCLIVEGLVRACITTVVSFLIMLLSVWVWGLTLQERQIVFDLIASAKKHIVFKL